MKITNILCVLLLYTTSLVSMESAYLQEQPAALQAVPRQRIQTIDNVPVMCTELSVMCSRQGLSNKTLVGKKEMKVLTLTDYIDRRLVSLVNKIARKSHKNMWVINDQKTLLQFCTLNLEMGIKKNCNIESLGKAYAQTIAKLKEGWDFSLLKEFPYITREGFNAQDWYLFIKNNSIMPADEVCVINLLSKKFFPGNHSDRRIHASTFHPNQGHVYLLIKKDAFEKVQEKFCFHLPSQEHLQNL